MDKLYNWLSSPKISVECDIAQRSVESAKPHGADNDSTLAGSIHTDLTAHRVQDTRFVQVSHTCGPPVFLQHLGNSTPLLHPRSALAAMFKEKRVKASPFYLIGVDGIIDHLGKRDRPWLPRFAPYIRSSQFMDEIRLLNFIQHSEPLHNTRCNRQKRLSY